MLWSMIQVFSRDGSGKIGQISIYLSKIAYFICLYIIYIYFIL